MPLDPTIQRLVDNFLDAKAAAEVASVAGRVVFLEEMFRKNLILSSASLFEQRIIAGLENHVRIATASDCVVALVVHKAIKRQYHTYFKWDEEELGSFPTLLGETRGNTLKAESRRPPTKEYSEAFMELGSLRNQLMHKNFAAFICEKTSEEIVLLCEKAERFVSRVEELLR